MKLLKIIGLTLLVSLIGLSSVWAHDDKALEKMKKPHDGQAKMLGAYHLELVVEEKALVLYVTDHAWNPSMITGVTARAKVLANKAKADLSFIHVEGNKLVTESDFPQSDDMKVVVIIKLPGQKKKSLLRFTPSKNTGANSPREQ